ncbi:hypothetical protein BKA80DRAFT_238503 [Phyllosticta citrichinensis]
MVPLTNGTARPVPRSTKEKRDVDIMQTNDSSIVSKRSVVELYHRDEPDFFRPFVGKFQRRSPLINRGYWLRMKAVEHTVKKFIEEDLDREKLVVNLGCGYDPLPFIILHKFPELVENTTFVDVDYPQLMQKKRACIDQADDLKKSFPFLRNWTSKEPAVWKAGQYVTVGCDLRQLAKLERILNSVANAENRAILFVAEVSVAYMDVKSADAVVSWASSFNDARFCILEQCLPDGPDHPFASTMLRHFEKLQTHLKVVYEYPTPEAQARRFVKAGWPDVDARTLWQLWGDDSFLTAEQRRALDDVEPFDEWEEFALFGSHYILLVARTRPESNRSNESNDTKSSVTASTSEPLSWKLHLDPAPNGQQDAPLRRFGAACRLESGSIHHGGYSAQSRLASVDLLDPSGQYLETTTFPVSLPLMCHTMTPLSGTSALFVGGRTSPNRAQDACYVVQSGPDGLAAQTAPALPQSRYRHCAVPVSTGADRGVLVFGGHTSSTVAVSSWLFWSKERGWSPVEVEVDAASAPNAALGPRFGASMYAVEDEGTCGVLAGGMSPDGVVLEDVWWWELSFDKDANKYTIRCSLLRAEGTNSLSQGRQQPPLARFGASVARMGDRVLIVGGITRDGVPRWEDEVVLVTASRHSLNIERVQMPARAQRRPLFIGTAVISTPDGNALLLGGGAVCFSMGSFWNTTSTVLSLSYAPCPLPSLPPPPPPKTAVPRIAIADSASFSALVRSSQPAIITNLPLGACVTKWTPSYLLEAITPERLVIIHSSSSARMTFATKNFSYAKETFSTFLARALAGEPVYLRSVASTQPAKKPTHLATDFAALAPDFALPAAIGDVIDDDEAPGGGGGGLHSSPLRISGPVALWCHYDVLANVLCQVRGRKRVRLYAPADAKHLGYAAGASSSDVDVWYDDGDEGEWARRCPRERERLARTRPWEGTLAAGEILFLPPMWSHAVRPETEPAADGEAGFSVAVNCFWRNLGSEAYAVGRDVYGNRDLAGYEEGRKAVEKIAKAFEGVPADLRGFYVDRLIEELREKVVTGGGDRQGDDEGSAGKG